MRYKLFMSPLMLCSGFIGLMLIIGALFAPWLAPQNPFDPRNLDLMNSLIPPFWYGEGVAAFILGTDDQGRDLLSAILFGMRISLLVGFLSVGVAVVMGLSLGLIAGYRGGFVDAFIMRVVDVQMTFPSIMVALLLDGVSRSLLPRESHDRLALWVIVFALALSIWPQIARVVRASTMVEKRREYVDAVRVMGRPHVVILLRHIMPNVLGPVLVIAMINLGVAILGEATLSFLGVGMPLSEPSLGTLIRIGQQFVFSGERWIVLFPGLTLALLVMSVNLLGDGLRNAIDPRLR